MNIICGKFDRNISFDTKRLSYDEKVRIGSKNPERFEFREFHPIATNGKVILDGYKISNARDFLLTFNKDDKKNLIALTKRERDSILDELIDFDVELNVFEELYPIFTHIKYVSNLSSNYNELKRLLVVIRKMGFKGNSLAHYISNGHLYKVERKIRFKNKLDRFFAFAYMSGYQEVFKLKEERQDKVIIALDFNSMYLACMDGEFVEPKSVEYKDFRKIKIDPDQIQNGFYRVVFKHPIDTFFKKFHPFKYNVINHSYYFSLEEKQTVELLLFKNEIDYYKKFFKETEIIEGFCSYRTIRHPLMRSGIRIYKDRNRSKKNNDSILNNLCKFKTVTMHSATNLKRFKTLRFKTKKHLLEYLSAEYMIEFSSKYTESENLELIQDYKYFTFKRVDSKYEARLINFDANDTVHSLSSQILANARIKMIKTIERFLSYKSVEICYANIDSLHLSVSTSELDKFIQENSDIISDDYGDLKIQSVADRGYWFDVGRYWLISGDTVSQFKNTLFNHSSKKTKFEKNKKLRIHVRGEMFSYVKTTYTNIENAFTYHKRIDTTYPQDDCCHYARYSLAEVVDLNVAGDTYNEELLKSKKIKSDLFKKIATVEG